MITNLQGPSHAFADTAGWAEMNNAFHDISDECLSNGIGGMKITGTACDKNLLRSFLNIQNNILSYSR